MILNMIVQECSSLSSRGHKNTNLVEDYRLGCVSFITYMFFVLNLKSINTKLCLLIASATFLWLSSYHFAYLPDVTLLYINCIAVRKS